MRSTERGWWRALVLLATYPETAAGVYDNVGYWRDAGCRTVSRKFPEVDENSLTHYPDDSISERSSCGLSYDVGLLVKDQVEYIDGSKHDKEDQSVVNHNTDQKRKFSAIRFIPNQVDGRDYECHDIVKHRDKVEQPRGGMRIRDP